jgi:hypothetical protein
MLAGLPPTVWSVGTDARPGRAHMTMSAALINASAMHAAIHLLCRVLMGSTLARVNAR